MRDKFLKLELLRILTNLEIYLNKLDAQEYYSETSETFLNICKRFCSKLKDSIETLPESLHQPLLKRINHEIIPLIRYVQRSESKNVPWSVIPNFEILIGGLLPEKYLILIRPQWHWNYSLIASNLAEYFKQIIRIFTGDANYQIGQNIHVISFPVLEKTNFLLHTIFGHEIGHFYQQKYFDKYFVPDWEKKVAEDIYKKIYERDPKQDVLQIASQTTEAINIYKGAVREVLPDIMAYLLFGPSILFALYFLSVWFPDYELPEKKNDYYPPLKSRIRFLYENFFRSEVAQLKKDENVVNQMLFYFSESVSEYLSDDFDKQEIESNQTCSVAYTLFNNDLRGIIDFGQNSIGTNKYIFESTFIQSLVDRISIFIPPNEVGERTSKLADLFLCGWIHFYETFSKSTSDNKTLKDFVKHYKQQSLLLLKAANLIHAKSIYGQGNVSTK